MFTVSPAVEHIALGLGLIAGIARTRRATRARSYGNSVALLRHISSVGVGRASADAVGTVQRDELFRPCVRVCVRVDLPARAAVSQGTKVSAASS